jgi:hypothetical protein
MADQIFRLTDSFVRPANTTAYADNDLVANSTTAGSVVPLDFNLGGGGGHIVRVVLRKSGTTTTNADFTIRLFEASPTVANGDNGPISHDYARHIMTLAIGQMVAGTDDAYVIKNLGETGGVFYAGGLHVAERRIFALVEANAAYTPASAEEFTLELTIDKMSL